MTQMRGTQGLNAKDRRSGLLGVGAKGFEPLTLCL